MIRWLLEKLRKKDQNLVMCMVCFHLVPFRKATYLLNDKYVCGKECARVLFIANRLDSSVENLLDNLNLRHQPREEKF